MREFLTDIDLTENELQGGVLENLPTSPSSTIPGRVYHDTTDNIPRVYDGTSDRPLLTKASGSPPQNPTVGDKWIDTSKGVEYICAEIESGTTAIWLSSFIIPVRFGRGRNGNSNIYLRGVDRLPSNQGPHLTEETVRFVHAVITTFGNETWDLEIRRNTGGGTFVAEETISITNTDRENATIAYDVDADERIAVYAAGNNLNRPNVTLYYRWRFEQTI